MAHPLRPLLLVAALAVTSQAQTPLVQTSLGHPSGYGYALSSDGSFAYYGESGSYFVWDRSSGLETAITGGTPSADQVSDTGLVPGRTLSATLGYDVPALYVHGTGVWNQLGALPGAPTPTASNIYGYGTARVTTPNATVVGGQILDTNGSYQPFRWTPLTGYVPLGNGGIPGAYGAVQALSDDGQTLGGYVYQPSPGPGLVAALWDASGTLTLPFATPSNPNGLGRVYCLSADGKVAGGYGGTKAMLSTPSGVIDLGSLIGSATSAVLRVSSDGSLAIGHTLIPLGPPGQTKPVYWAWTQATGLVDLQPLLVGAGLVLGAGAELSQFGGLTGDGTAMLTRIKTSGVNDLTHVELPTHIVDLGLPLAGTNGDPLLAASGSTFAGFPLSVDLSNALPGSVALLSIAGSSTPIPLYGGLIQAFPPAQLMALPTGAGSVGIQASWLTGASGASIYLQYGILDPGAVQGIALSNALQVVGL